MSSKTSTLRLSILDQSPVREGGTPADAFAETIELAQAAERLGYHRYWLAEHHGTEGLAGPAPEIMVARVAAATSEIRVGSGGVMLSHYSPYKVAETFRVLETLYPGRIDLGIGRAPGSDGRTAQALAYGSNIGIEYFPNKIDDLTGFLTDTLPDSHPFAGIRATPATPSTPEVWLLGSSNGSATYAAQFGLALSFAQFIAPRGGEAVVEAYRENFKPSALYSEPVASIGVFALCAETDEAAQRLGASRDLWRLRVDRGYHGPVPSPEEALAYDYTAAERARIEANRERSIIGTPDAVKARIEELAASFAVDEVVVLGICYEFEARLRSYELLADAFGLAARTVPPRAAS